MDTEKCKALICVLEHGNIHRAAEELGYTASGVSRMMAALEQELGLTLLDRGKHGVSPTSVCRDLLPHIRRTVQSADALEGAARGICGLESGTLRVGTAYPRFHGVLSDLLGRFHRDHPGIRISLEEGNSTPLAVMLGEGNLDVAIVSKRPGDFDWHPLVRDALVVLVPADHPLAQTGAGPYPLERLESDPYIDIGPGEDTDNTLVLRDLGIRPNVCYSISTDLTSYKMVDAGLGVCLTNSLHMGSYQGSSVFLPTVPEVTMEIGVASVPSAHAAPATRAFLNLLLPELNAYLT